MLKKIGFYCTNCDTHYDFDQKPYTTNEKPYTVGGRWSSLVKIPPQTWREKEGIRTQFTVNEKEIITKRAEVGRVGCGTNLARFFGPGGPSQKDHHLIA